MSFLDRIRACHDWQPEDYRPFIVEGESVSVPPLGWVTAEIARRLADFPAVFEVSERAVVLPARYGDFAARSAVLEDTMQRLHDSGEIPRWRGEDYGVARRWGEVPLFKMERAAVPLLGLPAYGVHVNGFLRGPDGLRLWVAKRAAHKAVAPGKFDHLVAGGQPYGLGLKENVIKEAAEEASITPELAATARPTGALRYICARAEGLRNDIVFSYDLELPEDFTPQPGDDEVESFSLWPMPRVLERLRDSDDFKFNVALVNLHFALRHGVLSPDDESEYQAIAEGLAGHF